MLLYHARERNGNRGLPYLDLQPRSKPLFKSLFLHEFRKSLNNKRLYKAILWNRSALHQRCMKGRLVSFTSVAGDDIEIRKARRNEVQEICEVLSESFEPYRQDYTEEAYKATVVSPSEIENRITDQKIDVLVAIYNDKIVGTASIEMGKKENLHIRSMAVRPDYQRKGIGWRILQEINRLAKKVHCKTITLECFEPLTKAVSLYENFGFRRTGRERDLYDIKIFEMMRQVRV